MPPESDPPENPKSAADAGKPDPTDPEVNLEALFVEAEELFGQLKQQCVRLQQARQERVNGKAQSLEVEQSLLREKLEQLELGLAFTILSSLGELGRQKLEALTQQEIRQEKFWHFVRYGGLGFVLGVAVKSLLR